MKLLIFNFMYYSMSQLHCISRLCIVAVLKFVINQHFFVCLFVCFQYFGGFSNNLSSFVFLFFFFSQCSFVHLPVTIAEGGIQNYENYAIPSFAYVGSAYRCVNY